MACTQNDFIPVHMTLFAKVIEKPKLFHGWISDLSPRTANA